MTEQNADPATDMDRRKPRMWQYCLVSMYFHDSISDKQLTYLLTYSMEQSPSNRFQLVKKFPAFYGTLRFITAVTSADKQQRREISRHTSVREFSLCPGNGNSRVA